MNKLVIIGNLTKDPDVRQTQNGKTVCNFSVAVNRRRTQNQEHPEADFFRVAVWGDRGEMCGKYLKKGKKVCVVGAVQVRTYTDNNNEFKANLEIPFADEVEFLSPKDSGDQEAAPAAQEAAPAPTPVEVGDELPF